LVGCCAPGATLPAQQEQNELTNYFYGIDFHFVFSSLPAVPGLRLKNRMSDYNTIVVEIPSD
jgi:hypothetical protein